MSRCLCLIRRDMHYRRSAFEAGLRAAGFDIVGSLANPTAGDLLVTWNRYAATDLTAQRFEQAGAAVVVVENGFLGASYDELSKAHAPNGEPLLAMALWHHNGGGDWYVGLPGRWREQGITTAPWRQAGDHVLMLPQRGIGPPGVAMPLEWPAAAAQRLHKLTERPVRVRAHPGNAPAEKPLATDLRDAWCCVTWGSSAALKALCAGVPVFTGWPRWIGAPACLPLDDADIEAPLRDDQARESMLDRLAWAQFTLSGVSSGSPFRNLMDIYRQGRAVAA